MGQSQFGTHKDIKKLIKAAQRSGWAVECSGGHIQVTNIVGESFCVPSSPGSQERVRRARYQFRKAGLEV